MAIAWTDCGRDLLQATSQLCFEPLLATKSIQQSIDWSNLLRKAELVKFYQGRKVSALVSLSGRLENMQIDFLETVLERYRLPAIFYKIIARLPDPMRLIPVPGGRK